jgi:hypothetical protein
MVPCPLTTNATGLAFFEQPFAEGAERFVYRCTEIEVPKDKTFEWYYQALQPYEKNLMLAERRGLRLVAKEAKDVENLHLGRAFHETFARVQHDAAMAALQFNQRMPMRRPEFNISFLPTSLYHCLDVNYKDNAAWVLVEQELDGKFTKWNNNAGAIRTSMPGLDALLEEDEDEDEDEPIDVNDVPQAFSHFSYEASRGKQLVCDLQGVWNPADGFMLTDPVVHYMSSSGRKHKNGATDKGFEGMKRFFQTHKCGPLCAKMLLPVRTVDDLIIMSPQKRMPNTQHM